MTLHHTNGRGASKRYVSRRSALPATQSGARSAYLYVAPAFVMFALFILLPTLHTLYLSLFQWDGLQPATWVGLHNFQRLFSEPQLYGALWHAVVLLFFFTGLPIALALLVTALVGPQPRKGLTAMRAVYFVPQVVPLIAIGIVWRWMYNAGGPVDRLAALLHIPAPREGWLGNFTTALPAIGIVGTWALYGLCLTLFLSGVQKVSAELYEALKLDGAGKAWSFRAVTLPSLRREIGIAAALTGTAALASFDLIYIATRGGPGDATVVPGLLVYRLAFTSGDIGGASALAVALTIITVGYILIVSRLTAQDD